MNARFFDRIANLEREHTSFAIATVVARRSPVSSHLGDRALVFADGHMEGFVGGSCSRDIVRRQALGAIRSRKPVLLQIRNAASAAAGEAPVDCHEPPQSASESLAATTLERVVIPMSCASEGAVDVYIEPRVPSRRLIVVGLTPVAEALAHLALALDYSVVRVVATDEVRDLAHEPGVRRLALADLRDFVGALDETEREQLVAIIASQGHYDELALEALDPFALAYTGLLASRRRAATVFGVLAQQGVSAEKLAAIRNPVGLDIGARAPGEVAVSILAEIIASAPAIVSPPAPAAAVPELDPVCGMEVEPEGASYRLDYAERAYVFCCAGCRASFAAEPARYLAELGRA